MAKATVMTPNVFTSAGKFFKGDVVELSDKEVKEINAIRKGTLEVKTVLTPVKKAVTKRKRARNANGTLKSDDPSTPNINEAYEGK